jgi:hypothetical protein
MFGNNYHVSSHSKIIEIAPSLTPKKIVVAYTSSSPFPAGDA